MTITGSERAGRAVGSAAGDAIKKSVLELGGSDPFVVLADADLPRVAALAARGRLLNAGQSCISPKRLVVDASVAEEFTRLLVAEVEALAVGDPEAPGTDVGPDGPGGPAATASTGRSRRRSRPAPGCSPEARRLDGPGHFYAPTVLTDVAPGQPAYDEEIFGPVAAVIVADGDDEAVRIANDTRFGLGASVWTVGPGARDRRRPPDPLRRRLRQRRSSPPTCGCPSAAPGPAATAASWPRPGSASSSTSAPGGSSTSPPPPPPHLGVKPCHATAWA